MSGDRDHQAAEQRLQSGKQAGVRDRILVFIPCYNCERQIGRVVAQLDERVTPYVGEILVVDNGSCDRSLEAARDALAFASAPWTVVRNNENYSLGGSHKVAFDYAIDRGFTHVVVLHGDDQADIHDFLPVLEAGLHRSYDSVLGARFMPGARLQGYSRIRIVGNHVLNMVTALLARSAVFDLGSGINCYSVDYLKSGFYLDFDDDLVFPAMMLFYGICARSRYKFVPISWREEDQVSNAKALFQAIKITRMLCPKDPRLRPTKQTQRNRARTFQFTVVDASRSAGSG